MILKRLKASIHRGINALGYRIEKQRTAVQAPIDVLELLIDKLMMQQSDLFFVQVGANDGWTDDPIRRFVTRYHWGGILVEPQPQVFQKLIENYKEEKQLLFENAAIADQNGVVKLFVADHDNDATNLTVFASLKKQTVLHGLNNNPKAAGIQVQVNEVAVPSLSVKSLLAKYGIKKVDLVFSDVQGYDSEVVQQFLACGVRPRIIHFEHCHTSPETINALYGKLVEHGYRFHELESDTLCYLPE